MVSHLVSTWSPRWPRIQTPSTLSI